MSFGVYKDLLEIPWEELGFYGGAYPSSDEISEVIDDIYDNIAKVTEEWSSHGDDARAADERRTHPRLTEYEFGIKFDKNYFKLDIIDGGKSQWRYLWYGNEPLYGGMIRSNKGVEGYYTVTEVKNGKVRTRKFAHMLYFFCKDCVGGRAKGDERAIIESGSMIFRPEVRPISDDIIQDFRSDIIRAISDAFENMSEQYFEEVTGGSEPDVEDADDSVNEFGYDVDPLTGFVEYS